jgi:hypothetical protein
MVVEGGVNNGELALLCKKKLNNIHVNRYLEGRNL